MRSVAAILLVFAAAAVPAAQAPSGGKESRTPAQRKIDSQLLQEIARIRIAPNEPSATAVKIDRQRRALVDVRVDVTPEFQRSVRRLGGSIVTSSPKYRSVVAWVPLLKLEELAAEPSVQAISPAAEAAIHR